LLIKLKEKVLDIKTKMAFKRAEGILSKIGYKEITSDIKDKSIIFTFDDFRVATLNMDNDMLGYSIEATAVFSADIISMKCLSDISTLIFTHRCSNSGIRPASENRVRLNLSYHIGNDFSRTSIEVGMLYLNKCLATLELYLLDRIKSNSKVVYDLSMFEHMNLAGFNPQHMGEKKEFVYGSWKAYVDATIDEFGPAAGNAYVTDVLIKIEACSLFEHENERLVAEVGSNLLDDLMMHRQLHEVSKTNYGIN
jgi:hypothetical protein